MLSTGLLFFPTGVDTTTTTTTGTEPEATTATTTTSTSSDTETTTKDVVKAQTHDLEIPDPFLVIKNTSGSGSSSSGGSTGESISSSCADNALVANWCDSHILLDKDDPDALQCSMLPQFHEYGCSCINHPTLCPLECLEGSELLSKTRSTIRCRGIPKDSPNYVIQEHHHSHRNDCADHSLITAWCDDYINKHVECSLYPSLNQYFCRCSGKATNCPLECLEGSDALVQTQHGIVCAGIPEDTINYEIN